MHCTVYYMWSNHQSVGSPDEIWQSSSCMIAPLQYNFHGQSLSNKIQDFESINIVKIESLILIYVILLVPKLYNYFYTTISPHIKLKCIVPAF